MGRDRRWDPCIAHRGAEVESFIVDYFGAASGKVLLIAGAGFDPRSTAIASRLAAAGAPSVRAILFQENRPRPPKGSSNVQRRTSARSLTL